MSDLGLLVGIHSIQVLSVPVVLSLELRIVGANAELCYRDERPAKPELYALLSTGYDRASGP